MRRRVYLETSVISYLTARPSKTIVGAAHQQLTHEWWERRDRYELFVSELVLQECSQGDPFTSQIRLAALADIPLLMISGKALAIASELVENKIVPSKAAEDALHIAIATVYGVDYLLTWNCRHIANPEIQSNISELLVQRGLYLPYICTPEELLGV